MDEGRLLQSLRQHKDIVTCIAVGPFILDHGKVAVQLLNSDVLLAMAGFAVPGLPYSQNAADVLRGAPGCLVHHTFCCLCFQQTQSPMPTSILLTACCLVCSRP